MLLEFIRHFRESLVSRENVKKNKCRFDCKGIEDKDPFQCSSWSTVIRRETLCFWH